MVKEKKTEVITVRLTASTKSAILKEAELRDWSPSKMAEKILTNWAEQRSEDDQKNGANRKNNLLFQRKSHKRSMRNH